MCGFKSPTCLTQPSATAGCHRRLCNRGGVHGCVRSLLPRWHKTVADHALHLTPQGRQQAIGAGGRIKAIVGDERVRFLVSPYVRTRETFTGIAQSFGDQDSLDWREDPRIREQNFGK